MRTDFLKLSEATQDAILQPTTPIQFDLTTSAIAQMQQRAAELIILDADDAFGYEQVRRYRISVVKAQRIAVEARQKLLKRPHIDYNREVDALARSLVEPMQAIEDALSKMEKTYNDERDRIAEEKARAGRLRYEARVGQLRMYGFAYDVDVDAFFFDEVIINVDDIRDLSDEAYEPSRYAAECAFRLEQDRMAEINAAKQAEAARVAADMAELEQLRAEQKQRETEQARLQKIADEAESEWLQQQIIDAREAQDVIDEVEQARYHKQAESDQKRADKARTKRLAREKKDFALYLKTCFPPGDTLGYEQPEVVDLVRRFNDQMQAVVIEFRRHIDAL